MANFEIYNLSYGKSEQNNQIVVRGELANHSGRSYSAVALRVVLFAKNISVASAVIVINNIPNDGVRAFEKNLEELEYDKVAKNITRYETLIESAY